MKVSLCRIIALMILIMFFSSCNPNRPLPDNKFVLSVVSEGQGMIEPRYGQYLQGTVVVFTIVPAQGWHFSSWEGNNRCEVNNKLGNWQILINGDKMLRAVFAKDEDPNPPLKQNLSILCLGKGRVTPDSGSFVKDEVVPLSVYPDEGWVFSRWEGTNKDDLVRNGDKYFIAMDNDKCLLAVFEQKKYSLRINIHGDGIVEERILDDLSIEGDYFSGTNVSLEAKPACGWLFKEWRYNDGSTSEQININIIMDSDQEVRVLFVEEEVRYQLEIEVIGMGKVQEKFISEGDYPAGTIVNLLAKPASGWLFKGWSGDEKGASAEIQLEMDRDKKIIAEFEPE